MDAHIAGHTNAIAQVAQTQITVEGWGTGVIGYQAGEGSPQGGITEAGGVLQKGAAMFNHPA
jgi:hypothetical protein